MRSTFMLAACGVLLTSAVAGQNASPTSSQLEALERFANAANARVIWSKEVARIDTDRAHAVVTALIVGDQTQTPSQMRGVRIDLSSQDAKDKVYTSEEYLDRLIRALDEISNGWPRFVSQPTAQANRCFGSGVFWQQEAHAFAASQCVMEEWTGLVVTPGLFRFTGLDPSPFAAAFARAREELKTR